MKKILFLLFTSLVFSCSTVKQEVSNQEICGGAMKNLYEKEFTQVQFDSICNADALPTDFSKWHSNAYRDFETHEGIAEYLYIKKLGSNQTIYRVEKRGTNYKITKRITIE